jgi:hypothetical protein
VGHEIETSEGQFWKRLRFTETFNARRRGRRRRNLCSNISIAGEMLLGGETANTYPLLIVI